MAGDCNVDEFPLWGTVPLHWTVSLESGLGRPQLLLFRACLLDAAAPQDGSEPIPLRLAKTGVELWKLTSC